MQKPQALDELAHHRFVGVIEEQRHRQHEVDDNPRREQPASTRDLAGLRQHFVDTVPVGRSGEYAETNPVGQTCHHDRVHHPNPFPPQAMWIREIACCAILPEANLRVGSRSGDHITFAESTDFHHSTTGATTPFNPGLPLICGNVKVDGIGIKPGTVHFGLSQWMWPETKPGQGFVMYGVKQWRCNTTGILFGGRGSSALAGSKIAELTADITDEGMPTELPPGGCGGELDGIAEADQPYVLSELSGGGFSVEDCAATLELAKSGSVSPPKPQELKSQVNDADRS